jgi:hypothetical protein
MQELSDKVVRRCPGGHPRLLLFRTPAYGYTCSNCDGMFVAGIRLFGCRTCDFGE